VEQNPAPAEPAPNPAPPALLHILGVSFGIAGAVGGTIGAGILRTPGLVAARFPSGPLILAVWIAAGLYALLGAICVAELGAALPRAGGWYVYARRAGGDGAGFAVGWIDWLGQCAGLAWVAVTIGEYGVALAPALPIGGKAIALLVLLGFALVQRLGLEAGSLSQKALGFSKALAFLALIAACLLLGPGHAQAAAATPLASAPPASALALALAAVFALQAVITTYDGWHFPIYFAEEFSEPATDLPRSLIGGVVAVIGLYLLVNLALLRVLPVAAIAASSLPLAEAARLLFGDLSGQLITALALLSCFGLVNAVIMAAPRVLYGLGRDGLFPPPLARVNGGGTPEVALIVTTLVTALLIVVADFAILLGIASFLYVLLYLSGIAALFTLRWREPELPRPFRAWGYPLTPAIVGIGSLAFLVGTAVGDRANCLAALGLVALSLPLRWLTRRFAPAPAPAPV
jgi:basic amino acid/polyamine antiporter, APA family